jgi:hypothetical protein
VRFGTEGTVFYFFNGDLAEINPNWWKIERFKVAPIYGTEVSGV